MEKMPERVEVKDRMQLKPEQERKGRYYVEVRLSRRYEWEGNDDRLR